MNTDNSMYYATYCTYSGDDMIFMALLRTTNDSVQYRYQGTIYDNDRGQNPESDESLSDFGVRAMLCRGNPG